ncbi:hypothetical protein D3C81_2014650 [compost metagenome]
MKPDSLEASQLMAVWRGEAEDDYGQLAIHSTMALALHGLGMAREQAFEEARRLWAMRKTST